MGQHNSAPVCSWSLSTNDWRTPLGLLCAHRYVQNPCGENELQTLNIEGFHVDICNNRFQPVPRVIQISQHCALHEFTGRQPYGTGKVAKLCWSEPPPIGNQHWPAPPPPKRVDHICPTSDVKNVDVFGSVKTWCFHGPAPRVLKPDQKCEPGEVATKTHYDSGMPARVCWMGNPPAEQDPFS